MQNKRRKPSNAMDGFVPRNRTAAPRRASVDEHQKRRPATDGFIPRQIQASMPLTLKSDDWVDENTLAITDADDLGAAEGRRNRRGTVLGGERKPHFWQFGKKRRTRKGKPEPSRRKKIVTRTILIILLIAFLVGGFLGWKVLRNATKIFNGNILGLLDTTRLKGEDQGRVNILLAGNSADDVGHDGANLTDSIMVVSLNTKDNSAFMISIPRDLYVNYGVTNCSIGNRGKINAAYVCGEQTKFSEDGYADGGMGLLSKVVTNTFGLDINYHALVNYGAFRDAVDAVGGINITLRSDDPRGIFDPSLDYTSRKCCSLAKYPNGLVSLNGKQALNLARARGDSAGSYGFSQGDFVRAEHQRQMLVALKEKTLSAGVLSNPAKIGSLFDSIGGNVKTDFKTGEIRRLYAIGKKVQSNNIKSIGLTDEKVSLVTTGIINSQSVVIPTAGTTNFSQIKFFIKRLISSDPLIKEGAKVVVLNASGTIGLAQKKADELAARGILVSAVGNAPARPTTTIVDLTTKNTQKLGTKAYLQKQYGVMATTDVVASPEAKNYQADFVILIGKQSSN